MMTQNCITCGKEATVFTGHVLRGSRREMITAGWCKEHLHNSENMRLMQGAACFGQWKPEHGIRENFESKSQPCGGVQLPLTFCG